MWPPQWSGPCAILASGPSMNQSVADQVMTAGIRAIAVNTTFRLTPWADMLYAADERWWRHYKAELEDFRGLRVGCEPSPGVLHLKNTGPSGFDPDPNCVRTGNNSGYQAIHVAVHTGCFPILLCGFDMKGCHWHGRHPDPLRNHGEGIYARWLVHFDGLSAALAGRTEVINCTPGSALRTFPMADLEEVLARTEPVKTASRISA